MAAPTIYHLYNGLQFSLAAVARTSYAYPSLSTLLTIQRWAIITDLAAGIYELSNFGDALSERRRVNDQSPARNWTPKLVGISCLVAGVVTFVCLPRLVKPKDIVVKFLNLAPEAANQFQMKWQMPLLDRFGLWLKLCRFSLTLGTLALAKNKYSPLLSVSGQALTLFKVAQLPWLRVDFMQNIEGVAGIENVKDIAKAKMTLYTVLPPRATDCVESATSHLEKSLRGIYNFTQHFFDGSRWKSGVNVSMVGTGVNTGTMTPMVLAPVSTPYFDVKVLRQKVEICACSTNFYIDTIKGWALNSFYNTWIKVNVYS